MSVEGNGQLADAAVEPERPEMGKVDQVAALLRDLERPAEKQAQQPAEVPETPPPPIEKWDLKTAAERLKVDPAKFYDLKVKARDGLELTVGELKDAWKSSAELEELRSSLTKARGNFEADQIRQARELEALLNVLPREAIKPEMVETYTRQRNEYLSREREAMLRSIPEWSDSAVAVADRKAMQDYLAQDDWPEGTLERIEDHRLFRTLKRAIAAEKELKALRTKVADLEKPQPKRGAAPAGKAQTEAQRFGQVKRAVTAGRMSQAAAAASIIEEALKR